MKRHYRQNNLQWVELVNPTAEEIAQLAQRFSLAPETVAELRRPSLKPRAQKTTSYLYLVLHFPFHSHQHWGHAAEKEVDFIIAPDFLITTRYHNRFPALERFVRHFAAEDPLPPYRAEDGLRLFLALVGALYADVEQQIDAVRDELERIERAIFEGYEKEMVRAISEVARDILNLKQSLDPHQEIWQSLSEQVPGLFGSDAKHALRTTEDLFWRARKHITHLWQTLTELRETNNSLLSTKQNEVMKIFTILAFVTFPLSLVASLFGMNTKYTPILGMPYDFWVLIGFMSLATVGMFFYFKHKRWL